MKTKISLCLVAAALLAINLHAQTTDSWRPANNGSTNGFWNVAANWSLGHVPAMGPAPGDKADFNSSAQMPCFVNTAAAPAQLVNGDGGPGNLIILNGGSLITSNYAGANSFNAVGYSSICRLEIQPGGSMTISNHLWVGLNPGAIGSFIINGGTANVLGMFGSGTSGGYGTTFLNGGILNLAQWNPASSLSAFPPWIFDAAR
jgi:hypothetical protein